MNHWLLNVNIECEKILEPLKVRSAPIDEWILQIRNVETFDYNTEVWVGETNSKYIQRYQNTKCFNCGRIGHLRRDCRQGIPRNNVSSRNGKNRRTQLLVYVGGVAKANLGIMDVGQQKIDKAT